MPHPEGKTMNDPGARDGWEARVLERMNRRRASESNTNHQYGIPMHWMFRIYLRRAAQERGISMSGYVRRALAVFIARDLGMSYEELCALNRKPLAFGDVGRRGLAQQDDGEGFGDWL